MSDSLNLYEEEQRAEARNYQLYYRGRLEELRRGGYIGGAKELTPKGWDAYLELKNKWQEMGITPDRDKMRKHLLCDHRIPRRHLEGFLTLIMHNIT